MGGLLEAVHDRTALQGGAAGDRGHARIGVDALGGHGERELDAVAGLPRAAKGGVTVDGRKGLRLAVDCEGGAATPAGDAEVEGDGAAATGVRRWEIGDRSDGDRDLAVPRVVGRDGEAHVAAAGGETNLARRVEVQGEAVGALRGDVFAERGEEAGDVGRAAGAAEPADALGLHEVALVTALGDGGDDLERVDVEELGAVDRHAALHVVVEGALHDVGVGAVQLDLEHPAREEDHADGGTGLGVGAVGREVEGLSELLAVGL